MMVFAFRQLAHLDRECQGLGEIPEPENPFKPRHSVAYQDLPFWYLRLKLRHFGFGNWESAFAACDAFVFLQLSHIFL